MYLRYQFFLTLGVLLLGIGMALLSVVVWLRFHVEIPADDIVEFLPSVKIGVVEGWRGIPLDNWLAAMGSAHRIVVTRLLVLVDYTFWGGKNYAIFLSTWVSIALLFVVYLRASADQVSTDRTAHYFIAGISLIFLFTPSQYYNLVKPINASWYVAAASSAVSVWTIISAGRNLSFGRAVFAFLFAAIAAFSNFFGVLTCLILPVVALYQRSRLWIVLLLLSMAFLLPYLQGIRADVTINPDTYNQMVAAAITKNPEILASIPQSPASTSESPARWLGWLPKPQAIARRIVRQLGTPLSIKHPVFASLAVIGSVLLLGFFWLKLAIDWYFRRDPAARSVQFYLAMATICLGVSCAIWIGRVVLRAPQAERYQTIVMMYWLSITCLIYCSALRADNQRKRLLVMFLAASIPVLFIWDTLDASMSGISRFVNRAGKEQVLGRLAVEDTTLSPIARERVRSNYEFLRSYGYRPPEIQADILASARISGEFCKGINLATGTTELPGVQSVVLNFEPTGKPFLTSLELHGGGGEVGSFYPKVPPSFQLRSILFNQWYGYYRGDVQTSSPVVLVSHSLFDEPSYCVLRL